MTSRPPEFRPRMLYIEEPLLEFGYGQRLVYPRDGLFLYGPVGDTKELPAIRYGVIGTPAGVQRFRAWAKTMAGFINIPPPGPRSRAVEPQHIPFPGFAEAFHATWPVEPPCLIADLDPEEIARTLRITNRHEAIRNTVDMFVSRLVTENNRLEIAPQFWFVVIPERVYELGRPQSTVKRDDRILGAVTISQRRARQLETQPTLFGAEEREAEVYQYATHFRRQLKARLLKDRIVTQIVRETTLAPGDFRRESGMFIRRVEDPATIAWKLGTGAYYKAGGKPWQLADVRPGVCYVGLVFKRSELTSDKAGLLRSADVSIGWRGSGLPGSARSVVPNGYKARTSILIATALGALFRWSSQRVSVCTTGLRRNCSSTRNPPSQTMSGAALQPAAIEKRISSACRSRMLATISSSTGRASIRSSAVRHCRSANVTRCSGHLAMYRDLTPIWGRKRRTLSPFASSVANVRLRPCSRMCLASQRSILTRVCTMTGSP